jgi:hypothetical protein
MAMGAKLERATKPSNPEASVVLCSSGCLAALCGNKEGTRELAPSMGGWLPAKLVRVNSGFN